VLKNLVRVRCNILSVLLIATGTHCFSSSKALANSAFSLSKMASQRSWGSNFQDFRVKEGTKRPASAPPSHFSKEEEEEIRNSST